MATATWTCNKDSRIADNGTNLGAGTSASNPFGTYSGYKYRTLMAFPGSMAGWTSITSAILHCRTSTQDNVAFGSDPNGLFQRLTGAWSEGSSSGLSASNAVVNPGPAATGTNNVLVDVPTAQSTWFTVDITAMMRDVLAGNAFTGIRILGVDNAGAESGSSSNVGEIYSREGGSAPYIVFTYETNVAPTAPTQTAPANGATGIVGTNPTLSFTHNDADGDALLNYDLQVSTDSTFASVTHKNVSAGTVGVSAGGASVAYNSLAGGAALSRGVTYYWRVAARSATGVLTVSPWSSTRSFRLNQLPSVVFTTPSVVDGGIQMVKVGGSATNPRMVVSWTFTDPDGGAQAKYQVNVVTDAGAAFWDSGLLTGTVGSVTVPVDAVRAAFYKVTVTVTDAAGETGTTGQRRCHAQWAVVEYRIDLGAVVTAWSTSAATSAPANTLALVEYASSAAGGAIAAWFSSIGGAALNRWFHYRVWLFAWNGAASPSFTKMSVTYTSQVGVPPDGWTIVAAHSLDTSQKVYGTQSLKAAGTGAAVNAWQLVAIQPNTDYILSGRIRTGGVNAAAVVALSTASGSGLLVQSPPVNVQQEFTRVASPVWNSGSNDEVYVRCYAQGAVGVDTWFDALKLEASTVVTSWNPGLVGAGVSVDAGGIQIDASPSGGAVFRMQGSGGATRDTVELGVHGLLFGGDFSLYSPSAGTLLGLGPAGAPGYVQAQAVAGQRAGLVATLTGDTVARSLLSGDASLVGLELGPGNAARDTNLYRSAANQLKTDDALQVAGLLNPLAGLTVAGILTSQANLLRMGGTAFPASPATNDLFYRTDLNAFFYWNGTGWQDVVTGLLSTSANVGPLIQFGVLAMTLTATLTFTQTLTFPKAFSAVPVVFFQPYSGGGTIVSIVQSPTASSVVLGVTTNTGTGTLAAGAATGGWIAIGAR